MVVDFMEVLKKIAWSSNVNLTVQKQENKEFTDYDLGLRKILLQVDEQKNFVNTIYQMGKERVLYFVKDYFEVEYCVMWIPQKEREYGDIITLGPYLDWTMDESGLRDLMAKKAVPDVYFNEMREYYNAIPILPKIEQWRELCKGMAEILNQGAKLQTEYISQDTPEGEFREMEWKDILSFKMIEERYGVEADLLNAISCGNTEEALKQVSMMYKYKITSRYKDPVRNLRNLLIIANTLCRKAAERGCVHPAYIDDLSTQIAKESETISTHREYKRFLIVMVRKYCMLVRNYSLRGCSPVVQKVVNHINLSLTEELALKRLSMEYSVNASYLSSLFKKEMGLNLTDYICQQRIRRAITLLNSTSRSIQDVAFESGIYDVNYFRKLFKKITGMTPTEYVKQVKHPGA